MAIFNQIQVDSTVNTVDIQQRNNQIIVVNPDNTAVNVTQPV